MLIISKRNLKEWYIESADYLRVSDRLSLGFSEPAIKEVDEVLKLEKSMLSYKR